jgi:glutamate dehydrogenase (NADP+)
MKDFCFLRGGDTDTSIENSNDNALDFLNPIFERYPHEPTFLQALTELAQSLRPLFQNNENPKRALYYQRALLLLAEPERIISFRVTWLDDDGTLQINRGWRVEFNSALGPYKGGLRFHPSVNPDVLKFLGFEQVIKNALTGLSLGGGKGGSDFDPKGKSDAEIKRFCQAFMLELTKYIHPSTDVPAGDIGVGGREIGYMVGQYKRLMNRHGEGILTGKSEVLGGSPLRPEATGYGLVYITQLAINDSSKRLSKVAPPLKKASCAISGSGNVAQYAAKKLIEFGAKVVTMSDSSGTLAFDKGMTEEDLRAIFQGKQVDRLRLSELENQVSGQYIPASSPWTMDTSINIDYAFPCATQNEINDVAAERLIQNGLRGVFEGANLPVNIEGQATLRDHSNTVLYIPGKAANAGGVGVSGFEMSQNAQKLAWSEEVVDQKLKDLMGYIYRQLVDAAGTDGTLEEGANAAGFLRVVDAMDQLGWL